MLVVILINVIIGLFISYYCLKGLDFDFSLWSFSINFILGGIAMGLNIFPVWNNHDNSGTLAFLASLMLIVGFIILIIGVVMGTPKYYNVRNLRHLGVIFEIVGIISLVTLWQRPLTWSETILPEIDVIVGLYLVIKYGRKMRKKSK